ncbi:porin [Thiomicrospira pelophila]|uniref:porin n=1 Tax=Thiomicrospira pelophila TaxID=934 RepID=UPI0004A74533|nr:porin [Thiomicrospira pelophila]
MKKNLIALAVASIVSAPAMAADGPQVFGELKYETGIQDGQGINSYNGTRIGIKGTQDLGNGMKGIYRIQGNVKNIVNHGAAAKDDNFNFNEEVWAGIKGSFGQIRAGNSDTATKQSIKPFRAFTDTLADDAFAKPAQWSRATGWHYQNKFDAVKVYATYAPNGTEMNSTMDVSATFKASGLYLSAAMQMIGDTGSGDDGTNMSVGAHYEMGQFGAGVLYQTIESKTNGYTGGVTNYADARTQITIPVNFKMTEKLNLRASIVTTDDGNSNTTTDYAFGPEYYFAKNTNFFATYWAGDQTEADLDGDGKTADNSIGFGISHKF